ncbi:MAG: hypothetical protein NXI01_04715 [Gammaproteobacteria bacterium]|nr:hypothetical protein [Gammaproteobacteria bacterium]
MKTDDKILNKLTSWKKQEVFAQLKLSDLEDLFSLSGKYNTQQVEKSYKKLAGNLHPDKFVGEDKQVQAQDAMAQLVNVKEYLIYRLEQSSAEPPLSNPFYQLLHPTTLSQPGWNPFTLGRMRVHMPPIEIDPFIDKKKLPNINDYNELLLYFYHEPYTPEKPSEAYNSLIANLKENISFNNQCVKQRLKANNGNEIESLIELIIKKGDLEFFEWLFRNCDKQYLQEQKPQKWVSLALKYEHKNLLNEIKSLNEEQFDADLMVILKTCELSRASFNLLIDQLPRKDLTLETITALIQENIDILKHLPVFSMLDAADKRAVIYHFLAKGDVNYRFLSVEDRANPLIIALVFAQQKNRSLFYDSQRLTPRMKWEPCRIRLTRSIPLSNLEVTFIAALFEVWPDLDNEDGLLDTFGSEINGFSNLRKTVSYRLSRKNTLILLACIDACIGALLIAFVPVSLAITPLMLSMLALLAATALFYRYPDDFGVILSVGYMLGVPALIMPFSMGASAVALITGAMIYGMYNWHQTIYPKVTAIKADIKTAQNIRQAFFKSAPVDEAQSDEAVEETKHQGIFESACY